MIDKQKIIEILNKESVSENGSNNRVIIEQDFEIIASEIIKLFAIPVVMQALPKRLSNSAYIQATHKGYDEFMTWWDKQV